MGLELQGNHIIFFDTAPFIYFFEKNPVYFPKLEHFFEHVYMVDAQIITSIITYIEITTQPSMLGDHHLALKYRDYFTHSENISLFPIDLKIADQAVAMRVKYGFKTPDAVQIGTAVACGADYIVTNDKTWKKFDAVPVLLVEEL